MEVNIARAREMGITEEELAEAIHIAASVGAGSVLAMANRNSIKSANLSKEDTKLSDYLWKRR